MDVAPGVFSPIVVAARPGAIALVKRRRGSLKPALDGNGLAPAMLLRLRQYTEPTAAEAPTS